MATRRRLMRVEEAIELVMEEGSDDEENIILPFSDDEDHSDSEESEVNSITSTIRLREDTESEVDLDLELESDDEERFRLDPDRDPDLHGGGAFEGEGSTASRSRSSVDALDFEGEISDAFDILDAQMDVDLRLTEDPDTPLYKTDWCKDLTDFPLIPPFLGHSGFHADMPDNPSPLDFYELFITNDIIKTIKSETNKYARRTIAKKDRENPQLSPRSMFRQWTSVTKKEIYQFLAICIHMSVVDKPYIDDYFSKNPVLCASFPSLLMKRDRFKSILSFLHLNDNDHFIPRGQEGHDPLHKVRPLHDHLNNTFKAVYTPQQNVCIDEALCPWRGRLQMKVYMKDKPIKWGIKLYELCDSRTGYVWSFEVMSGQPGISNTPFDVVHRLMDPLFNKGYCLFVDNYYCNPALCDSLAAQDTMVVGTVRSNRIGLPKDFMNTPVPRGQMDFMRRNQLIVVKWKDKREVNVLTTKHTPEMIEHTTRTDTKQKPTAVVDYTKNMCGVDRSDQLISYTPLHRKSVKWWKKLAFHFLTLAMVQAYILYNYHKRQRNQRGLKLSRFIVKVCLQMATDRCGFTEDDLRPNTGNGGEIGRLSANKGHFPVPIDKNQRQKRLACIVCYERAKKAGATRDQLRNKTQRSHFKCKQCDKVLCVYPCFEDFHTKRDYLV